MSLEVTMKVFCIDDEPSILEWLVKNVEWEAYNCEIVGYSTKAVEALDYIEKENVDLLITDISMPEMSGLELIKAVKKRCPDISVIIISAYSDFQYVKEALKHGVINYLLKPIDTSELYDCLKIAKTAYSMRVSNYHNRGMLAFRNSVLHELITGGIDESRFEERCELADIPVKSQTFRVVVADTRDKEDAICLTIAKRFNTKEFAGCYYFWDSQMNLVILVMGEPDEESKTERRITEVIRREGGRDVFLCIGKTLTSYRQIPESYQACCDFLDAKFLFSGRAVNLVSYQYEEYHAVIKTECLQRLSYALQADDREGVVRSVRKKAEGCKAEAAKKKEIICLAVFVVKNIKLLHPSWEIVLPEKSLESQETSEKMLEWITAFYTKIISIERDKRNGLYSYVGRVLQEVANHYNDKELSLQRVADRCGVTTAYLGKLFRAETGEFFNDYLLRIRLKAAEALLIDTKRNIGEVSAAVGFSSQSYFNKVFRRAYKMSPMEYRNHLRHMEH